MIALPDKKVYLEAGVSAWALGWRNNPQVNRWCRQYTDLTSEDHEAYLQRLERDKSIRMFTVKDCRQDRDVGVCGLTSINHVNQTAEFSLYIGPEHQKNGYGKDALETLVSHGFRALNLNRIWGEVFVGNPAMAMFEEVGFRKEGRLRESYFRDGKFIDSEIIALLRSER